MLFYIVMNLGIFVCIILFGLCIGIDNIWDYVGLYIKDFFLVFFLVLCFLFLGGFFLLVGFFGKFYLFWCGW